MFKEEVWALEPERIETFFLHHREVHATADGYRFRDCRITVTDLPPRRIAVWHCLRPESSLKVPMIPPLLIYRQYSITISIRRRIRIGGL